MHVFAYRLLLGIAMLFSIAGAPAVWANGPLTSEIQSFLITTDDDGREQRVPTTHAAPGDVIEYLLTYTNTSEQPLSGLIVTGPIPANTQYLEASAHADVQARLVVSVDDGVEFAAEPLADDSRNESRQEQAVIPADTYTHLRWLPDTDIQPGQVQTFSYRVQVL